MAIIVRSNAEANEIGALVPDRGMKNYIINGGFDIWQRGTSFSGNVYTADRWETSGSGTKTTTKMVHSIGTTFGGSVPACKNYVRLDITEAGDVMFLQKLEDITRFQNKTVTFSCWLRTDSDSQLDHIFLIQSFGTGGSPSSAVVMQGGTDTELMANIWTRIEVTVGLPSIVGKELGADKNDCLHVRIDPSDNFTGKFDIAQVQLEEGSVATPFEQRPYGLELSLCQRYYEKIDNKGVLPVTADTSNERGFYTYKVPKRVTPSVTINFDAGSDATFAYDINGGYQNGNHSSVSGFSVVADAEL